MIEAKKCASSSTTLETLTGHQRLPRAGTLGVQDDVVPQLRRPVLEVSLIRSSDSLASVCSVPTFSSNP